MSSRAHRYKQNAPAPLYVPSSTEDDDMTSEEANHTSQHRYSTLPEDDYISPTKNRSGRYTYGQPTPHHASRTTRGAAEDHRGDGRTTQDTTYAAGSDAGGGGAGGRFRVRLHHTEGVLDEMAQRHLMAPSVYMALHTTEERGHSRTVHRSYNPEFTDMFDFHSTRPDRDALVCTLVALPVTAQGKERKIAECVVSLKNLMWGVEREVWVPMVRHAGTKYAYEQGEVMLSIFSDDFGVEELPTVEEETAFSIEAQRILRKYAPDELHRLDWIVGEHLLNGDQGLLDIRARYGPGRSAAQQPDRDRSRSRRSPAPVEDPTGAALSRRSRGSAVNRMLMVQTPPAAVADSASRAEEVPSPLVRVRLTVQEVADLTSADGGPLVSRSCYLTFRTRANEVRSKIHRYQSGVAAFSNEAFDLSLEDPMGDPIEVTVCAAGRCLGEAQIGLANVEAGREKKVEIMLVRAADTADATPSGRLRLTLCTPGGKQGYTSPFLWSKAEERQVRERVLAYLWTQLRDDLHRLDAIVGTIDVPDAYMREWSRTMGPEPKVCHLSLLVSEASALFDDDNASHTVFVRVTCGPCTAQTPTIKARGAGAVTVHHAVDLTVLNPNQAALELMVIEVMPNGAHREVSRIVLGLRRVPRRDTVKRTAKLITHACSRAAHECGQLAIEMVAQDFGVSARHVMEDGEFARACKSLSQRCAAEERHRVPYVIDTASSDEEAIALLGPRSSAVEQTAASSNVSPSTSAPMTVRVLGLKQYSGLRDGCYVEAILQQQPPSSAASGEDGSDASAAAPFLRTQEKKSAKLEVTLDISNDNEATTNFTYKPTSKVIFRVMRSRRLRKDQLLAQTEVRLANLICGETNTLWLPLAAASASSDPPANDSTTKAASADRRARDSAARDEDDEEAEDQRSLYEDDRIRGNRLPKSMQRRAQAAQKVNESTGFVLPPSTTNNNGTTTTAVGAVGAQQGSGGALLGVELRSNAFPITSVVHGAGADAAADVDGRGLTPMQAVTRDVTSLVRRYRPEKQGQVQTMIAQCTSLQEAHREIRAEICPRDVEATIYLHIDAIEMEKMSGRQLEAQGEVGVVANFGSECQVTQKRLAPSTSSTTAQSGTDRATTQLAYAPIRLDLPGPEQQRVPPLQLTLVPLNGGAGAWSMRKTNDPSKPGSGTAYSLGAGAYGERDADKAATDGHRRRRHRRSTLGGRNNLRTYFTAEALEASAAVAAENAAEADGGAAAGNGAARRHTYTNGAAGGDKTSTSTSTNTTVGEAGSRGGVVVVSGGLGTVRVSLRALLSQPLHRLGDRISVPIVCLQPSAATAPEWAHRAAPAKPEVVGQLTFHLSAPAFEEFPEWTHLASRSVLAEVSPTYVHYYVRRLGAYLRQCAPGELVDFHYGLFERDVASGSWPVSLYDWMLALLKRFRKKEAKDFGPEPQLRFNPEEREARRQMESYYARQAAFDRAELEPETKAVTASPSRSTARARGDPAYRVIDDPNDRPFADSVTNGNDFTPPEKSRSRARYADPEAEVDPRTEPPRRAARAKQGGRSQAPTYSF